MNTAIPFNKYANEEFITITAHVILGKVSKKCKGLGICSITLEPPLNCSSGSASYQISIQLAHTGKLKFVFPKTSMSESSIYTFFGNDQFKVGEHFLVPDQIAAAFGLPAFLITAGEYPIENKPDVFVVEFHNGK